MVNSMSHVICVFRILTSTAQAKVNTTGFGSVLPNFDAVAY
jgi:hypothetical protein